MESEKVKETWIWMLLFFILLTYRVKIKVSHRDYIHRWLFKGNFVHSDRKIQIPGVKNEDKYLPEESRPHPRSIELISINISFA